MTDIETAIFAAAYVDALRNMFEGKPAAERVKLAQNEAEYVVAMYRQHHTRSTDANQATRAEGS